MNKQNVFELSRRGYALMNGPKWQVSRALRRFLADEVLGGQTAIQSFAFEDGYSRVQFTALEHYAQSLVSQQKQYFANDGAAIKKVVVLRDEEYQSVFTTYELAWHPTKASLQQLQEMAKVVIILADSMHKFAANTNDEALFACPEYCYRGLPCNIQSDELLWSVSGQDKRGGSGVLEWCYDQLDAEHVFNEMSRFPERFTHLRAARFQDEVQLAQPA